MSDSYIMYRSFAQALSTLKMSEELKVRRAIDDLALNGNDTEISGRAGAIWTLIKPQIIANAKRKRNGQKGGRPKAELETNGF